MARIHNRIDAAKFKELKAAIKNGAKRTTVANRNGVSVETLRRVYNAKNFAEYQAANTARKAAQGKTTTWTQRVSSAPVSPKPKKKGVFGRFFGGR